MEGKVQFEYLNQKLEKLHRIDSMVYFYSKKMKKKKIQLYLILKYKGNKYVFPYGPIEEPTRRIILDEIHVTTTAINLLMRRQPSSIAAALIFKKKKKKSLLDG